ncbi:MAG: kelch repeat-containing protein [Candidatus Thermoplasmatota archaeon]|nr:kelch repeat-containing protein [Candidatus Thermoplasmatota archaeon]
MSDTLPTGLMKTAVATPTVSSDTWYCFGGQAYDEGTGPTADYWDGIIRCKVSEEGAVQDLEVSVSAPAESDVLTVGEEYQIIINFSNQVEGPSSDIYFSDSSTGGPWELVVNATATIDSTESQQYTWAVPNNVSSTCYLKVVTNEKELEQRVATGYSSKFTITSGAAEPALSSLELNGKLPIPLKQTYAVWHNGSAYIFGGQDDGDILMDGIYRYDASTDTITTMGAKLPNVASNLKAVSTDYGIYLYSSPDIPTGKFWVYDPVADTIDSSQDAPPNTYNMAVYNGQYIYLMGGLGPAEPSFEVWAYDPSTKNLSQYNTPAGSTYRYGQTAVLVGDMTYLFGGYLDSGARAESLNIFVMNFTVDDVSKNIVVGPDYLLNYDNLENTANMVGYYDGTNIIAFAGTQVISIDIVNGTYKVLSVSIPATNDDTALAYDSQGDFAYLFGGGTGTNKIYKFGIDPTIPEPIEPEPQAEEFKPSINNPTTIDGTEIDLTMNYETDEYYYEVTDEIKVPINFSDFAGDYDVKFIIIKIGEEKINMTPGNYDGETWQSGIFDVIVDTNNYENGEVKLEVIYGYSGKNESVTRTYSSGNYIPIKISNAVGIVARVEPAVLVATVLGATGATVGISIVGSGAGSAGAGAGGTGAGAGGAGGAGGGGGVVLEPPWKVSSTRLRASWVTAGSW